MFQIDRTVEQWLGAPGTTELYLEFGEDIDHISRLVVADPGADPTDDPEEIIKRVLEQVKHRDSNVTLRSAEAVEAVVNFLEHRAANPNLELEFLFSTNALAGCEKPMSPGEVGDDEAGDDETENDQPATKVPFIDIQLGTKGIDVWEDIRKHSINDDKRALGLSELRNALSTKVKKPTAVPQAEWELFTSRLQSFDLDEWDACVTGFEWRTGVTRFANMEDHLVGLVKQRKHGLSDVQAGETYRRLFYYVARKLSEKGLKILTREALETLLASSVTSTSEIQQLEAFQWRLRTVALLVDELAARQGEHSEILKEHTALFADYRRQFKEQSDRIDRNTADIADLKSSQPSSGDPDEHIQDVFQQTTNSAVRRAIVRLPLVQDTIPRSEVEEIESHLSSGRPVILLGASGTGKTGICHALAVSPNPPKSVLLLDAREVLSVRNRGDLADHFQLARSLLAAIRQLGQAGGCRVIVDQLDNTTGLDSARVLVELAIECSSSTGVEIVVVCRTNFESDAEIYESATQGLSAPRQSAVAEIDLLAPFFHESIDPPFHIVRSLPLDEGSVRSLLGRMEIVGPSDIIVDLGSNLLNLRLIATIKRYDPQFDFNNILSEVDLWERFAVAIQHGEDLVHGAMLGSQLIEASADFALVALESIDFAFQGEAGRQREIDRLKLWQVVAEREPGVFTFTHDMFAEYLFAARMARGRVLPQDVFRVLNRFRAGNVLGWMEKIYSRHNSPVYENFLKAVFGVN